MKKGRIKIPENMNNIPLVTKENPYKYLGVWSEKKVDIKKVTENIKGSIKETIKSRIFKKLSSINVVRRVNSNII